MATQDTLRVNIKSTFCFLVLISIHIFALQSTLLHLIPLLLTFESSINNVIYVTLSK